MKVACDFCEKVIRTDDRKIKSDWRTMKLNTLEFLLCEKCSDDLFHYIDKAMKGDKDERANQNKIVEKLKELAESSKQRKNMVIDSKNDEITKKSLYSRYEGMMIAYDNAIKIVKGDDKSDTVSK